MTQHEKGKYNHKILQARDFQHSKGNFVHLYIDQTYLGVPLLIYIREASTAKNRWQKGLLD